MTQEEYKLFDFDNIHLPPLTQRPYPGATGNNNTIPDPSNNNNTSSSHNDATTIHPSGSSDSINHPTDNTDRSMDTTTTPTIPTNTITMTTGTSNTNTAPTNTFANIISNLSNYKENLIHQLLGTQGPATNTISNNISYIIMLFCEIGGSCEILRLSILAVLHCLTITSSSLIRINEVTNINSRSG